MKPLMTLPCGGFFIDEREVFATKSEPQLQGSEGFHNRR